MSADDVSKIIVDFLSHSNTITGESKQISMFENE
jgi:hypothetical protein